MTRRAIVAGIITIVCLSSGKQTSPTKHESLFRNDIWRFSIAPPSFKGEPNSETAWLAEFRGAPAKSFGPTLRIGVAKQAFEPFVKEQESALGKLTFKIESRKDMSVGKHDGREIVCVADALPTPLKAIHTYVRVGEYVFSIIALAPTSQFDVLEVEFRKSLATFAVDE